MPLPKSKLDNLYQRMGIDSRFQGCIMLDTEPITVNDTIESDDLYYSDIVDGLEKWTQGIVSESTPHVTLLFGLQESGNDWKAHVDSVLDGWEIPSVVSISNVSSFDSDEYHCIVAKVMKTPNLVDGNTRLRHLPHIDTFKDFTPHVTLAYIKKNDAKRDDYIKKLNERLSLKRIPITGINYGD